MGIASTALVTGAAKRIGAAIGLDLAKHGYNLAVHYGSSEQEAESVVRAAGEFGVKAVALSADLSVEAEVETLLDRTTAALGPVGVLVNNASAFLRDDIQTATRETWDAHMEVNLRAPFVLSQAFARSLGKDGEGAIVNIIDHRVWNLTPHYMTYTLSKSGLWALTRTMALALAPAIRVNGIGPGPVLKNERQTDEQFRAQFEALPLRRAVSLDDICAGVRYLIENRSMTGQMLAIDAGEHLAYAQPDPDAGSPD